MTNLPVPKDPAATAIEKGIEEAAATARHYLDKLVGAGLEEGGGILGDTVAYWRFKNKVRLVLKAKAYLESRGINPRAILPKIVAPILEAGSLEVDEDMQDRWSALLANAATPDKGSKILPGYSEILRQLTPIQARTIDWMYGQKDEIAPGEHIWGDIERQDVQVQFELSDRDYALLMSDLHRLQLIDGRRHVDLVDRSGTFKDRGAWTTPSMYQTISLTPLALNFVEAYSPPAL